MARVAAHWWDSAEWSEEENLQKIRCEFTRAFRQLLMVKELC